MKLIVAALGIVLAQAYSQTSGAGACRFNVPAGWNQTTTRCDGACRNGHADGLGVLKEYRQQSAIGKFTAESMRDAQSADKGTMSTGQARTGRIAAALQEAANSAHLDLQKGAQNREAFLSFFIDTATKVGRFLRQGVECS